MHKKMAKPVRYSGNRKGYSKAKRMRKGGKGETTPEGGGE